MEAEVASVPNAPLILTLEMDRASQERFDRLREAHYPVARNQIAAHLTLFHHLPETEGVRARVAEAADREGFTALVSGVRSLGRGVAFGLASEELIGLHRQLSAVFKEHLIAQDRQKFWPHVVVQNKVSGEAARALKAELEAGFQEFAVEAVGLRLWRYLGGPWELAERFPFSG